MVTTTSSLYEANSEEWIIRRKRFTLCILDNFAFFYFRLLTFFKTFFSKTSFKKTTRVSNGLDPDNDRRPDLGPNCLQRFSADNKSFRYQGSFLQWMRVCAIDSESNLVKVHFRSIWFKQAYQHLLDDHLSVHLYGWTALVPDIYVYSIDSKSLEGHKLSNYRLQRHCDHVVSWRCQLQWFLYRNLSLAIGAIYDTAGYHIGHLLPFGINTALDICGWKRSHLWGSIWPVKM